MTLKSKDSPCSGTKWYTYVYELNSFQLVWLGLIKIGLCFVGLFDKDKYKEVLLRSIAIPGLDSKLVPLFMTSFKECVHLFFERLLIKMNLLSEDSETRSLKKELSEVVDCFEQKVVIHAPMFTEDNLSDGYMQRIKKIDELFFRNYLRIYVLEDGKHSPFVKIKKINSQCYFIEYNSHCKQQRDFVFDIIRQCHLQYIHSLNRLSPDSVNQEMCQILKLEGVRTVWDVHGAVPEEHAMCGDFVAKDYLDAVEHILYQFSDIIVVVNNATTEHLKQKHGITTATIVLLPIFNVDINKVSQPINNALLSKFETDTPKIVYCGGIQKWQNIDLMYKIIRRTSSYYRYHILVPEPDNLASLWDSSSLNNIIIEAKNHEEVFDVLKDSCFGFLLRDDGIVNRVSCPTKILEYIQSCTIPILKSTDIGDFKELGLKYIDYSCLLNCSIPEKEICKEYVEDNLRILSKLHEQFNEGKHALSMYFSATKKMGE